jgi:hypothetical protein
MFQEPWRRAHAQVIAQSCKLIGWRTHQWRRSADQSTRGQGSGESPDEQPQGWNQPGNRDPESGAMRGRGDDRGSDNDWRGAAASLGDTSGRSRRGGSARVTDGDDASIGCVITGDGAMAGAACKVIGRDALCVGRSIAPTRHSGRIATSAGRISAAATPSDQTRCRSAAERFRRSSAITPAPSHAAVTLQSRRTA